MSKRKLRHTGFIDRLEGDCAVIIIEEHEFDLPIALLPTGLGEGSHLTLILENNKQSQDKSLDEIKNLQNKLAQNDPGDDIEL